MAEMERVGLDESIEVPSINIEKLVLIIGLAFGIVVAVYVYVFNTQFNSVIGGAGEWGQFGDYVGGLLNPALSALALVILAGSLNANVKALKQNKEILNATKQELELTRKQIENSNSLLDKQEEALTMQIQAVQGGAHAERLGKYAEFVFGELERLKGEHPKPKFPVLRIGRKYQEYELFNSFDILDPAIVTIRKKTEWSENEWQERAAHHKLNLLVMYFREIIKMCRRAKDSSGTSEMAEYYGNRIGRWIAGAMYLGYLDDSEEAAWDLLPEPFQDKLRELLDDRDKED